jgi:hypothetical protein
LEANPVELIVKLPKKRKEKKEKPEQGFGFDPCSRNQFQMELRRFQSLLWTIPLSVLYITETASTC